VPALKALLDEWSRTDVDYAIRVSHLSGSAGGVNGSTFLATSTVSDDNAIDDLIGGSGSDWFIALTDGPFADKVTNRASGEVLTTL